MLNCLACKVNVGLAAPELKLSQHLPPSLMGVFFAALAFMTLLDCSTERNLRYNGSSMFALEKPKAFAIIGSGRVQHPNPTRLTKRRDKCLRHSRRHRSDFSAALWSPEQFRLIGETEPLCVEHRCPALYAVTSWLTGQPY